MNNKEDLERAKEIARKYGFTANEKETAEGLTRNILAVLSGQQQLHELEVKQLNRTIRELERRAMSTGKHRAASIVRDQP